MSKILRKGVLLIGLIAFFLMLPVVMLPTVQKPSATTPEEVKILEIKPNEFAAESTFQGTTCEVIVLSENQKFPLRMTEEECSALHEGETLNL